VWAGEVKVAAVKMLDKGDRHYRVDVTLKHDDTGWDHYADGWKVLDQNKNVMATRVLYHPHVDEQPFTRSLYDVVIPQDVKTVYIQAHDKIHGDSELYKVELN
jgi:hypothetical protein